MSSPSSVPSGHRPASPSARRPVAFGLLRQAEHVLFVGLLALGVGRSVADPVRPWAAAAVGLLVLAWYGAGVLVARRTDAAPVLRRRAVLWLAGLTVGWVALVVISPNFVWLVFAVFLLYLQAVQLRWSIPAVLLLTVGAIATVAADRQRLSAAIVIGPLTGAAVAIVITVVYRDLREEAERRERLMAELTSAQQRLVAAERHAGTMAERERLAHEIHDTVAQGLSSIVLLLHSLRSHADALPDHAGLQLDAAVVAARAALEDTRRVVRALGPAELAGQSLVTALARLVSDAQPIGIEIGFDVDGEPYELPTRTAVALLRTAQGALGNVMAHSQAQHAQVTLTYQPHQVSLDVADDGRGFDRAEPAGDSSTGTGIGLNAMRTRLVEVRGTLTVESAPGVGTAIRTAIPTDVPDG